MTPDEDDRSAARAVDEADRSDDMESKLDELDEHITDARKKADAGRPQGDPPGDDPVDDIAGGGTDHSEEADDPEESPIIGPE
jgi:hypothetical protein